MKRMKIAIVFGTKPNFEYDAFKYFILYVNRIQDIYEFCFPDILEDYPFEKGVVNFKSSHEKVNALVVKHNLNADHYIAIITNSFNNNYFFNCVEKNFCDNYRYLG
jgi:hypothetical protein